MMIRETVVAGHFYPADSETCLSDLRRMLGAAAPTWDASERVIGGLVPHAGWMCSGAVAAKVFQVVASARKPTVIVLFGGVHRHRGREAALFAGGRWETPIGPVQIDERLAERIQGHTNLIVEDPYAHQDEHSIEVQMPFIKHLFPEAKVVPLMVPPVSTADEVGQAVGRTLKAYGYDAAIIGTTDLTHYGPNYGFTPHGVGAKANAWAKEVNDRRFIELVCAMNSELIVAEAGEHKNACSSGAAAATVAATAVLGAREGVLLEHTSSSEVLGGRSKGDMADSVGYAAVVFK